LTVSYSIIQNPYISKYFACISDMPSDLKAKR